VWECSSGKKAKKFVQVTDYSSLDLPMVYTWGMEYARLKAVASCISNILAESFLGFRCSIGH
jgi:hypothetical protein